MKPDMKLIAEWAGYEAELVRISDNREYVDYFTEGRSEWLGKYNPLINDAQAFELLRKFWARN